MEYTNEQLNTLALDVLLLSRNTLLVNLRFLDMALSRFTYHTVKQNTLLTDGNYLLYDPKHILRNYKRARELPVRDYLHTVLHCVFRHMFMDPSLNRVYWDLACDIAAENMITELGLQAVAAARVAQQAPYVDAIRQELGFVSAEKIYSYLRTAYPDPEKLARIRGYFYADNHELWYMTGEERSAAYGLPQPLETNEESASAWKTIAERMQVDLEAFHGTCGHAPGSWIQNLRAVNRERYDYTAFLKKFAVPCEKMKVNEDEFDYIFYTYGLRLYEKMPLIEPLEYKEVKAIREFVIAIDTSGSTSGALVQKFVQKTYNILKSTESFFTKINLHIIQCDAEIQEDKKITSQEEFDEYLQTMMIRGHGGTDFRPVFWHVEELRRRKEFTNLKGLIYFTDGCGTFPARKPDYDTAFIFLDDNYTDRNVPPWAIKLFLQKDEI